MSVVEDVRQVIQDFLAPELRALTARIEALEVKMDSRFEALNARISATGGTILAATSKSCLRNWRAWKGQLSLDYRVKKLEQAQEDARPDLLEPPNDLLKSAFHDHFPCVYPLHRTLASRHAH